MIKGKVNKVTIELTAVMETDNATSPLAIYEKIFDDEPPGQQAINTKPTKNTASKLKV